MAQHIVFIVGGMVQPETDWDYWGPTIFVPVQALGWCTAVEPCRLGFACLVHVATVVTASQRWQSVPT